MGAALGTALEAARLGTALGAVLGTAWRWVVGLVVSGLAVHPKQASCGFTLQRCV